MMLRVCYALRVAAGTAGLLLVLGCSRCPNGWNPDATIPQTTADGQEEVLEFPQYRKWPFDEAEAKRRQNETAARLGVSVEERLLLGGDIYLDLMLIPAGRFVMGFERCRGNEPHEVLIVRPYYIGKLEMTWRQYALFRQDDLYANRALDVILKEETDRLDDPVDRITWMGCVDYCKAVSEAIGCTVRLPSEAEWEYACRAGTRTRYIHGDTLRVGDANAACLEDVAGRLMPVQKGGQWRANPWGVYDTIGNVAEWVYDKYGDDEWCRAVRDSSSGDDGVAARRPELRTNAMPFDGFRVVVDIDRALLEVLKKNKSASGQEVERAKDERSAEQRDGPTQKAKRSDLPAR